MPLSKSENKLLEITRDPYFEDVEWEYCIFGVVQMGEGEGARSFFEGLDMGAIFLKSQIWGLGLFLRLNKWGQEIFLACEIGGLVFFIFDSKIPENPAWVSGKLWTFP